MILGWVGAGDIKAILFKLGISKLWELQLFSVGTIKATKLIFLYLLVLIFFNSS